MGQKIVARAHGIKPLSCVVHILLRCNHGMWHPLPLILNLLSHPRCFRPHMTEICSWCWQVGVRTKTIKKAARIIVEKYYPRLSLDFQSNKRLADEVAIIPSKRLRNRIAGYVTHLMKRIQRWEMFLYTNATFFFFFLPTNSTTIFLSKRILDPIIWI